MGVVIAKMVIFAKCFFDLSADACGIGIFCTDGFPEAENSAMQHIRDCAILDLYKPVYPKNLEVFMATRTICFPISGYPYCKEQPVTFTWINGSKRQNIRAVHDAVHTTDPDVSILERTHIPWAYYMTWSKEFCIGEKYNTKESLLKMYESPYAVTL